MKVEIPRMLSENPISWLTPKKHYKKMEEKATKLSETDLLAMRNNYEHIRPFSWTVGALSTPAAILAFTAVAPHLPAELTAMSVGVIPAIPCILGVTRHNIRAGEKSILDGELTQRGIVFTKAPGPGLKPLKQT